MKKVFNHNIGKAYDVDIIATKIGTPELRKSQAYKNAENDFIDKTMSCNINEAIAWMQAFMTDSIVKAIGKRNDMLRAEFLAAYDLYNRLTKSTKSN